MNWRLDARTLMKSPVYPLRVHAPVREAAAFLARRGIGGAPVLDGEGQGKGVFSLSDLALAVAVRMQRGPAERTLEAREPAPAEALPNLEEVGSLPVEQLMTPGIVTVAPDASLADVLRALGSSNTGRIFVREDPEGALEGIITATDVMHVLSL